MPCYEAGLDNLGSTMALPDLFTFDTHASAGSTIITTADVQCLLNAAAPPSLYFTSYLTSPALFAYLGNGDLVDFTTVPLSAAFHLNTLTAKRAALGSSAVMEVGDVYAVRISATTLAWVQVTQVSNTAPATSADICFRTNRHGYRYLKFDVTAYGDANCNTSGVTLY